MGHAADRVRGDWVCGISTTIAPHHILEAQLHGDDAALNAIVGMICPVELAQLSVHFVPAKADRNALRRGRELLDMTRV
jgi:hypothetical protein